MAITVLGSQGLSITSGRILITAANGVQLLVVVANFGGGAQGAAIDTFASANAGPYRIQELLESSN